MAVRPVYAELLGIDIIATAAIQNGAIITNKLADSAVTNPKIATNAIDNRTLSANSVNSTVIANNGVQTANIQNGAVTDAKTGAPTSGVLGSGASAIFYARYGGIVHVWTGIGWNATQQQLPVGFRPANTMEAAAAETSSGRTTPGGAHVVRVASSGWVSRPVGVSGMLTIFSLSFAAA